MNLNTGTWVVLIFCGVLLLGYILGYYYNRQQAEKIFPWLQKGLGSLGTVTRGAKLPGMATGGRLEVNQPVAPLRTVETVYLLAPRENLIFWIFSALQGRGDELIVWVTYKSTPEQSVEVARRSNRQYVKRLHDPAKPAIAVLENAGRLQVAAEDKPGSATIGKVQALLQRYPNSVVRLSLRPDKPHLFLRINLRIMQHAPAEELFTALKGLIP
ncbi:MAG TPA: hypothetical protein VF831_03200 [Anaerolineales bacterium]